MACGRLCLVRGQFYHAGLGLGVHHNTAPNSSGGCSGPIARLWAVAAAFGFIRNSFDVLRPQAQLTLAALNTKLFFV